jgi:hypothetical protein
VAGRGTDRHHRLGLRRSRTSRHDLASARLNAMLMFGSEAANTVLRSYQQHSRDRPSRLRDLAYFDIIAALATPADMQLWNERGRFIQRTFFQRKSQIMAR